MVAFTAILLCATRASARAQQHCTPETAAARELAAHATRALDRYRDPARAREDGYRPAGYDLPLMGRHWINPREVMSDTFDVARPGILIYLHRDGTDILAGAAYTALVDGTEAAPGPPALRPYWHSHEGDFTEEMFSTHLRAADTGSGLRLIAMHVWTHVANPDGVFAADNRILPWLRAHRSNPVVDDDDATRALAFATVDAEYWLLAITRSLPVDVADSLRPLVAESQRRVQAHVRADRVDAAVEEWKRMLQDVRRRFPASAPALAQLTAPLQRGHCR